MKCILLRNIIQKIHCQSVLMLLTPERAGSVFQNPLTGLLPDMVHDKPEQLKPNKK